ncbi:MULTISPECIES: hypothetical protein [unclassified Lactococcus]|uniref:hypothetical protein n=1 Tax=unclassified Lactococcus TaxID=2643510 RepID=UPI0011CC4400|nr:MULTISPECIES: hypothetical protein [unclassified Lactococcus]MQW23179.1 hypothetical protein [Lactococcus sp. dk101]TXK44230.1 hypothetical protein FVP42_06155 [Lactococcus sp. dk310]TXK49961.1 hypothetical protein FVP43_06125 [Lactococcus sp. dk322]
MTKLVNFYLNTPNSEKLPRLSRYFKEENMLERENRIWVINLAIKELFDKYEDELKEFEERVN